MEKKTSGAQTYNALRKLDYTDFLKGLSSETLTRIARETHKVEVLEILVEVATVDVRKVIAGRKLILEYSAKKLKEKLLSDPDKCVRKALANNLSLCKEDLKRLAYDSNTEVVVEVCKSILSDDDILSDVLERSTDIDVFIAIADNPNVSTNTLCSLYKIQKTMYNQNLNQVSKFKFDYLKCSIASSKALTDSKTAYSLAVEKSSDVKFKLLNNPVAKQIQGLVSFLITDDDDRVSKAALSVFKKMREG